MGRRKTAALSYTFWELDGLIVVRWGRTPEVADVQTQTLEVAAVRKRQGKPIVALYIMPPDSQPPDNDFRQAQAASLPAIFAHLEFAIAVFEGSGFVASLKRSALVAILLLSKQRHSVYVRQSLEDALIVNPPRRFSFDASKALQELQRKMAASPLPVVAQST